MKELKITNCPGTLKTGYDTYSSTALKRMFNGRRVSHLLPYNSPTKDALTDELFEENQRRISISGVQEKFSVCLEKNKLRLIREGEHGQYILKPIPSAGRHTKEMPANEHVSMQIARQVFDIQTAENCLIFFRDGSPAYLTKRFDVKEDGSKKAQEDFASLAGRTPQTHGENYKYLGSYAELFELLRKYVPAYSVEAPKLFKLILFNYLISNGDAHIKNFSLLETELGDFILSPAYDLLNSRIHIKDSDFALAEGLLPPSESQGKISVQFHKLGQKAGMSDRQIETVFTLLLSRQKQVKELIAHSYLSDSVKRNYEQAYLSRIKKLQKA
jgi:serine/threonine-protein kinase HipA